MARDSAPRALRAGPGNRPGWRLRAVLVAGACLPLLAAAAPWKIDTGVSTQATYTDNIDLAPPGQEQGDFVLDVTPRITIRPRDPGKDARINLNLDYNLQTFTAGRNAVPSSLNHRLQADVDAELVRQMLFIDARATMSQQNLTNTGTVSDNNISNTGNRTDVVTFAVSPYVRHHLGRYADTEVRYTFDKVFNDAPAIDSRSNRVNGRIESGSRFPRLPWSAYYSRQEIRNSDNSETTFRTLEGQVGYRFNRHFSSFVNLGVDSNEFATSQGDDGGFRWLVGGTWTPTERTSLSLGFGERFFGKNYSLDFRHRSRRTVWTASYTEDTTTTRDIQLGQVLVARTDAFGEPVTSTDPLDAFNSAIDNPTLTTEVLVSKRLEGSFAARGRRSTVTLRVYSDRREFQVSGNSERVIGSALNLSRRLSRNLTGALFGQWQSADLSQGAREDERWDLGLRLSRQLGRDVSGALEYRHIEQDSNVALSEFEENRYSARVSVDF